MRGKGGKRPQPDWLHGLLVVDKPSGRSSAAVVAELRHRLRLVSVGHTGTLDPLASGVLPVVVGQATKLAGYLLAGDKEYVATVELGVETDSLDRDGVIVARAPAAEVAAIDRTSVEAALARLRGPQVQVAPVVSAIKQGGRRLYERVRDGEQVEPPVRAVTVYALELLAIRPPQLELRVACSKGTFVRALARDLGRLLGVGAHVAALRRTRAGRFAIDAARAPADITAEWATANAVTLGSIAELPRVNVSDDEAIEIEHGRRIEPAPGEVPAAGQQIQLVTGEDWVIAVAHLAEDGRWAYDRVLRRPSFVEGASRA